jgi:hypothetical protein
VSGALFPLPAVCLMALAGTVNLFTFTANGLRDYGCGSNRRVRCMLDLSGSRLGPVMGSCVHVEMCQIS